MNLKITLLPNGNLLFQADNASRADLAESLKRGWQYAETDFLEEVRGQYSSKAPGRTYHYTLEWLHPADIFALTDMPMLADTVRDDDDAVRVYGPVWGFPDYQVRDHLTELAQKGRTEFVQVADYGPDGMTFPSRHGGGIKDIMLVEKIAREAFEHCLDGEPVIELVPDIHSDEGDTIRRLVGFRQRPPAPVVRDLLA